jgi:hypothetical protein
MLKNVQEMKLQDLMPTILWSMIPQVVPNGILLIHP